MNYFISFITDIFSRIVDILNIKIIPGFPLSFFQLMCCTILIKVLFNLIFGGFKEIDYDFNFINQRLIGNGSRKISKSINNINRKEQINNYVPKHEAKK